MFKNTLNRAIIFSVSTFNPSFFNGSKLAIKIAGIQEF